ncbi:hypothetical protein [Paracoccus aerius]|uniref:Uncharacterized protein n=1 Tax=Paracoccus aerius TaxID=1915382 RepID=A0ABS1S8B4_9RHOB|nr:hypothetical protein [Paracoccus aerius]MBL3674973.1 hypothetical protein [Paracoccus aerius]
MDRKTTLSRLRDRIGSKAAPQNLTPLLDEHLERVSGGRNCGCGHSSNTNHASQGSGGNHVSQTRPMQQAL